MQDDKDLELFLGKRNLKIEETFCQTFSESSVELEFKHDDSPRTDGKKIYNDPEFLEIYQDEFLLKKVEDFLHIPEKLSRSHWNALKMVTRALSIHECLHILYTDFSLQVSQDVKCRFSRNKTYVMHTISNIIEDSFIESYGASVYENITGYLKFIRMATALVPPLPNSVAPDPNAKNIIDYLNYFTDLLLFRFYKKVENNNSEISPYIEKTRNLFFEGSIQTLWKKRYDFTRKIFDIILPLIPDDNVCALDFTNFADNIGKKVISNRKHLSNNKMKESKNTKITRRLFEDLDGKKIDDTEDVTTQLLLDIIDFEGEMELALNESDDPESEILIILPTNYDKQNIFLHRNIKIIQSRKSADFDLKESYEQLANQYRTTINTYKSRIFDLLQAKTDVISDRQIFGHGISSKYFGDPKKRFWYRKEQGISLPSISFLFLIDGSGSMFGPKLQSTKTATLIMHEVLQSNNIEHCIVEHRAGCSKPEIEVNILFDFNAPPSQKYNIMQLSADSDNRDSLALIWAEKYIETYASNDSKMIIVLSDGLPAHDYDMYYPPRSVEDTALTVSRISHHGIVALTMTSAKSIPTLWRATTSARCQDYCSR